MVICGLKEIINVGYDTIWHRPVESLMEIKKLINF